MEEQDGCRVVGEGMADMAGIGIMVGFVGQALISLGVSTWVFFLTKRGHLDALAEAEVRRRRLECVSDILMVGNDIQMLLGTSYMITVFAYGDNMDLYHLRLVFDIVSFVGPSGAAALVCWSYCNAKLYPPNSRSARWTPRHRGIYIFAALYLALVALVCRRLSSWSPEHCYHSRFVSSDAHHPAHDKVYVALTGSWMLLSMLAALFAAPRWRHSVLLAAALQFPVHLYMALALRTANQGRLEGERHENRWDFGQTTAVILLGMAVRELFCKLWDFYLFHRDLRGRPPLKTPFFLTPRGAAQ